MIPPEIKTGGRGHVCLDLRDKRLPGAFPADRGKARVSGNLCCRGPNRVTGDIATIGQGCVVGHGVGRGENHCSNAVIIDMGRHRLDPQQGRKHDATIRAKPRLQILHKGAGRGGRACDQDRG